MASEATVTITTCKLYKTKLCGFHLSRRGCNKGRRCNYAHTQEELRQPVYNKRQLRAETFHKLTKATEEAEPEPASVHAPALPQRFRRRAPPQEQKLANAPSRPPAAAETTAQPHAQSFASTNAACSGSAPMCVMQPVLCCSVVPMMMVYSVPMPSELQPQSMASNAFQRQPLLELDAASHSDSVPWNEGLLRELKKFEESMAKASESEREALDLQLMEARPSTYED